jgi:hypothetical protein
VRRAVLACAAAALIAAPLQAGAAPSPSPSPTPPPPYALAGEARGLELAITDQGVTLGAAVAESDSTPKSAGLGAGQCEILGDTGTTEAPCNASTAETSEYPGDQGDGSSTCAAPTLPAPLNTALDIRTACGFSRSGLAGDFAVTENRGTVGLISLQFDLSGLSAELDAVKDQVVDGLKDVLVDAPGPVGPAVTALLDSVDEGEAGRIRIGNAESVISKNMDAVEVVSTAGGAEIGLIGIPDLDATGNPIPGSSNALEDGLIIIEVGDAESTASLNPSTLELDATADAATVKVFVRDITQYPAIVYQEVPIDPDQSATILPDTPLESTISAGAQSTQVTEDTALAASDALALHLLQDPMFEGGLQLGLARTTAAAAFELQEVQPSPSPSPSDGDRTLPATGGRDRTAWGLIFLALVGAVFFLRRRLHP